MGNGASRWLGLSGAFVLSIQLGSAWAGDFSFAPAAAQSLNLAETRTVEAEVRADPSGPGGEIQLSVDRTALRSLDPDGLVQAKVEPPRVRLEPGQSAQIRVTLQAPGLSPSFEGGKISLVAEREPGAPVARAELGISVKPVLEIRLYSGAVPLQAPMKWSTDETKGVTELRRHPRGVTVRFINLDPNGPHVIHASGAIEHQDLDQPMAAATAAGPGGTYEQVVRETGKVSAIYYCHDVEDGRYQRVIRFNTR